MVAGAAETVGEAMMGESPSSSRLNSASPLGTEVRSKAYYTSNPTPGLEALPPGQRKNLARGKPMPPGIAKRFPPDALRSSLSVPPQYDVIVVGWDVLLVEVATGIIHDVLMDVIR